MNLTARWKQFGLRSCLLLMLAVGLFLAGYRVGHSQGRYERSQHPPDAFDDLVALICSTIQARSSGDPWILRNEERIVEPPPTAPVDPNDPFASAAP